MSYEKMMADLLRESEHLFPETPTVEPLPGQLSAVSEAVSTDSSVSAERKLALDQVSVLKDLQVEVTVELGRFQLTVEELIDLVPGKILRYELQPGQRVGLKLSGTSIGEGRLVQCEGRTGIEILALSQAAEILSEMP